MSQYTDKRGLAGAIMARLSGVWDCPGRHTCIIRPGIFPGRHPDITVCHLSRSAMSTVLTWRKALAHRWRYEARAASFHFDEQVTFGERIIVFCSCTLYIALSIQSVEYIVDSSPMTVSSSVTSSQIRFWPSFPWPVLARVAVIAPLRACDIPSILQGSSREVPASKPYED